jgi:NAD(P)-dependent dehydrogenase (short-subunit alcohol dehydrogenase family)
MGAGRLIGRVALVTGGAQGIGLACARRFAQEGARVVLVDLAGDKGPAAAAALVADGFDARFEACDVTRRDDFEAVLDRCDAGLGGVDILLNNAGIALQADILTATEVLYDQVMDVNLKAAFFATQAVARRLIAANRPGVILNMSSVNAVMNIPHLIAYNLSKGGLNQLTKNAAIALAPHNIRVCGIGPGTIMTDLARNAVMSNPDALNGILSRTPLGRAGEPEEIAAIAVFLASDDASYVTGETVYADGGRLGLNYTVPVR